MFLVANGPTAAESIAGNRQAGSHALFAQAGFCKLARCDGCGVEGEVGVGNCCWDLKVSGLQRAACCDAGIDEASGTHARRGGAAPCWSVEHGRGWVSGCTTTGLDREDLV